MTKTLPLLQLSLIMGLALGTSACQSLSDAASGVGSTVSGAGDAVGNVVSNLNPFGSSDDAAPPSGTMADAGASADTNAATTPDLSSIPAKPATSTPAQQQAAAQSLAADGAQARYSADSLRAGTEASAAPPTAMDLAPPSAQASAAPPSAAPPSAGDAPPSASDTPPSASSPTAARTAAATPPPASTPSAALSQGTAAVPTAGSPPPGAQTPAGAAPSGVQTAALAPPPGTSASPVGPSAARPAASAPLPPGAEPAVPANAPMRGNTMVMGSQVASDAALGFRPSTAPPLNSSINQWVAPPVLAHYRQTASNAGISLASNAAVPPKGAVMSDMDTASSPISNSIAAMNGGIPPSAIVYFPGDGAALSAAARTQIRAAVSQYKATGGNGSIRVVGHASSRTPNMPVEKHLELIFSKSQARANAVAQELIHEGVPAAKVLVEAVGDSQPVYYESMPQGEDGNRRTDIFVQS